MYEKYNGGLCYGKYKKGFIMKNYFEKLQSKVDKYKNKYAQRPRKAAFKLAWWNFKCIFKKHKIRKETSVGIIKQFNAKTSIAFILGGGIGDIIIGAVYISKFIEKIDIPIEISIFVGQSVKSIKSLLYGIYDNKIYSRTDYKEEDFDLSINLDWQFPKLTYRKDILFYINSSFLSKYIKEVDEFNECYSYLCGEYKTLLHQHFLLINKKTRLTGMDITGQLELSPDSFINLTIPKEDLGILEKYNLQNRKFITIQRGVDANAVSPESIKLWSLDNYSELVKKIKQKYPDYTIVQLGINKERCEKINNIDIDLRGETSFAEVITLLGNSDLHIDCECGMVHVRHFLCRKTSVVLFGPTSDKIRGYKENINIRSNACNCPLCEWITGEGWQTKCPNILSPNICMKSITPEMVINAISAKGVF